MNGSNISNFCENFQISLVFTVGNIVNCDQRNWTIFGGCCFAKCLKYNAEISLEPGAVVEIPKEIFSSFLYYGNFVPSEVPCISKLEWNFPQILITLNCRFKLFMLLF